LTSKFEKIERLKSGEVMDEIPVSFWRHFPIDDLRGEAIYNRHKEYLRRYDIDLVKFSLSGGYMLIAFGCEVGYTNSIEGAAKVTKFSITKSEDWEYLREPSIHEGILSDMLRGIKMFAKDVKGSVPFIVTVFSPLTVAYKMSGNRFLRDLRTEPRKLDYALQKIANVTKEFSNAALEAGASGIFFAEQLASYDLLSEEEYKNFGSKYDIVLLKSLENRSFFNVLHIHGSNLMFDMLVQSYPVDAVNWYDRGTSPSLEEALGKFKGVLIGGLNEKETLTIMPPEAVRKEVIDAITQTGRRRLILGPGCVVPMNAVEGNLDEVIRTAREHVK